MLPVKEYRTKIKGLSDLLNLGFIIDETDTAAGPLAIAAQKDGSLMCGFSYAGPDLESQGTTDLEFLSAHWNRLLSRYGSNFGIFFMAIREEAGAYIDAKECAFEPAISQVIEAERRAQYELRNNQHFTSRYYVILTWTTPSQTEANVAEAMIKRPKKVDEVIEDGLATVLNRFKDAASLLLGGMNILGRVRSLDATGLISLVHESLSGDKQALNVPLVPAFLDVLVGNHDLLGGLEPAIDDVQIAAISVTGYPSATQPEMLELFHTLPVEMRYTLRFLSLDQIEARPILNKLQRHWHTGSMSLGTMISKSVSKDKSQSFFETNQSAVNMAVDAKMAENEAAEGAVKFGFLSFTVVLRDKDSKALAEKVKFVRDYLNNSGFVAKVETVNCLEAFLSSIPGQLQENVRRPMVHTMNLADMAPKTAIWAGAARCPNPLMAIEEGKKAPPLLYATTTGSTPFRLNLHVGDVGHTLIAGVTGGGKSTLLGLLAAQWFRYKDARVISFDKGMSMYALTKAMGGQHYDIQGEDDTLTFAPLQKMTPQTEEWIEALFILQGLTLTSSDKQAIHTTLNTLIQSDRQRKLVDFQVLLQDTRLKQALEFYTSDGRAGPLMSAAEDGLDLSAHFMTFELDHLLQSSSEASKQIAVPVLLYIFQRIEAMLDGRPTLILLDEAWSLLDNPLFADRLKLWLKTLRKKNASVVFATQSLMDLKTSPLLPVLKESCPTKIFLPNRDARSEEIAAMYKSFGLRDRQIELLASATPKQDYYVTTSEVQRCVDLTLGPVTLAFTGVSDPKAVKRVQELIKQHNGSLAWTVDWLRECKLSEDWVRYLQNSL